jgi:hypothetical protein
MVAGARYTHQKSSFPPVDVIDLQFEYQGKALVRRLVERTRSSHRGYLFSFLRALNGARSMGYGEEEEMTQREEERTGQKHPGQ